MRYLECIRSWTDLIVAAYECLSLLCILQFAINEDDEELTKLRKRYGPLVANAVGVASLELATWNPSGKYPISMPWDFKQDEKATMKQIILRLVEVIEEIEEEKKEIQKEVKEKEKELKEKQKQLNALKSSAPALKRKRA